MRAKQVVRWTFSNQVVEIRREGPLFRRRSAAFHVVLGIAAGHPIRRTAWMGDFLAHPENTMTF